MLTKLKQQFDLMTGEERKSSRKVFLSPVYFQHSDLPWTLSKILNISNNGACVRINGLCKVGDEILLELPNKNLKVSEVLSVKAEVRWVKESLYNAHQYECGVMFKERKVKYSREKGNVFSFADIYCLFMEHYTKNCIGKTVNTLEEIKEVYSILYNEYSVRRLCAQNEARLHYNFFNLIPETRTFVLKRGKDILGTISIILDSPCGLPMETTYPQEIKQLRAQGMRLGEIGCLALNSRFFKKTRHSLKNIERQAHLFKLFKTMFDYARFMTNCTDLMLGCHPKHAGLYKFLDFEEVTGGRVHKAAGSAPSVLMKFNIENVIRNHTLLNEGSGKYFLKKCDSMDVLRKHFPWTAQTVRSFLYHLRPLWDQLSKEQRQYITKIYPSI